MRKYLKQLLQDLENAKSIQPPIPNYKELYPDHPAFSYGLDYIVAWEMAEEIPMTELFDIEGNRFPPSKKLTPQQMEKIIKKIIELWAVFRFDANFPDEAPIEKKYLAITRFWQKESVTPISSGFCIFELCDTVVENCPWGEDHCSCKTLQEEMEDYEPEPIDEEWWEKGVRHHPDGGTSWINPDLLDENGKIKGFQGNDDGMDLPF